MRKYLYILISAIFLLSSCAGTQETKQSQNLKQVSADSEVHKKDKPKPIKDDPSSETAVVESMLGEGDPFNVLLAEAKVYYTNALMAQNEADSVEVELQLKQCIDALTDIELYNNLDNIQHEEFSRFTNLIATQFKDYAPQTKMIHDKISALELREFVDGLTEDYFSGQESGDYRIIDDRDGHMPVIVNTRVAQSIHMFKTKRRGDMQTWLREKAKYERLMREILKEYQVPEEFIYLSMIESEFKTDALSHMGAMGLWQFMTYTGKYYGLKYDYWVDERRDPVKSTIAAAKYFRYLHSIFNDWYLVMASYNAGEGRISRSIKYEHTRDYWKMKSLPRATRNYVPYILAAAAISYEPAEYNFKAYRPKPVWEFDTLTVHGSYELEKIARVCGVKFQKLLELNPALRKLRTPAYSYTLRLPKGKRPLLLQEIKNMEKSSENGNYIVSAGDNLTHIANRFGVKVDDVMAVNQLKSKERIYVGQKLLIPGKGNSYLKSGSVVSDQGAKPDLSRTHQKIIYVVKSGDTLGEIAEIYNTRASRIRLWNGLVYGEHIFPKQKLNIWIPKGSTYQVGKQYHTVKSGDSFARIATRNGVTVNDLKKLNPGMNASKIFPGDRIRVR